MQGALEDFFRALRASDVRVSPAEAIDAHRTVAKVGFADRELFKDALCATLAKTADEVDRFDRTFDTFFTRDAFMAAPPLKTAITIPWKTCPRRAGKANWPAC